MADFDQTDCERRVIHANEMPAFRFVPDKSTSRSFVTFTIYDEETNKKKCDMKIQSYDGQGPRKDMLKWLQSLSNYFATKEFTVDDKIKTVSLCLSDAGSLQN